MSCTNIWKNETPHTDWIWYINGIPVIVCGEKSRATTTWGAEGGEGGVREGCGGGWGGCMEGVYGGVWGRDLWVSNIEKGCIDDSEVS